MSLIPPILSHLESVARQAGEIALLEKSRLGTQLKADGSIVSTADQKAEEFIRKEVENLVNGATIWGEEMGHSLEGPGGLWLIDPIDGTSNFVYGSPFWGVSIGYFKDSQPKWGAVVLPELGASYLAEVGTGAFYNGVEIGQVPPGTVQPYELVSYPDRVVRALPGVCLPGKMRHQGAVVVDAVYTIQQRFRGLIGVGERMYDIAAVLAMGLATGMDIRYASGEPMIFSELLDNEKITKPWIMFPPESGFFA